MKEREELFDAGVRTFWWATCRKKVTHPPWKWPNHYLLDCNNTHVHKTSGKYLHISIHFPTRHCKIPHPFEISSLINELNAAFVTHHYNLYVKVIFLYTNYFLTSSDQYMIWKLKRVTQILSFDFRTTCF